MARSAARSGPLGGADLKALARQDSADYGKDFSDEDWERMAERVRSLTRLILRIQRREEEERRSAEGGEVP